jgi:CheY-like chemotaxis protein
MAQIIDTTVGAPVAVSFDVPDDIGTVEADPSQFETALLNMVINARDAMSGAGALVIRARQADSVPPVRRHAACKGAFVAVSVEDDGTGIDPDTLGRIFEPFFTTKDLNKGTGLGLSQVYGFAKQSGGEIAVVSEVGHGSIFTLYLPRVRAAALPDPAPVPANAPRDIVDARKVLLVEDNVTVGGFASALLAELGQTVTWVTNGEAALDLLAERHDAFDLVFSDVVMPGINGIELGLEIRRRWPELEVVLTSGYSHVLAEEGSHGFALLQKPYSVDGLLGILQRS